jgi:demethoxyubiquinone hydroxylase (CLK1/Coq7/Cat5 family)
MAYDVTVLRPEMRTGQVLARGADLTASERRAIRKALRTLHTLEIMATKIYACQAGRRRPVLDMALATAMCNEMTHIQDFQTKLYEYGMRPSKLRWSYWLVGYALGLGSRLLGRRAILKTGIWTETKAVDHYGRLLSAFEWGPDTRMVIEKDQADEYGHIERWKQLLGSSDPTL